GPRPPGPKCGLPPLGLEGGTGAARRTVSSVRLTTGDTDRKYFSKVSEGLSDWSILRRTASQDQRDHRVRGSARPCCTAARPQLPSGSRAPPRVSTPVVGGDGGQRVGRDHAQHTN